MGGIGRDVTASLQGTRGPAPPSTAGRRQGRRRRLLGQQPLVQFRGAGLGSVPLLGQVPHPYAELVRKGLEVFNAVPQQGYFGGICSDAFVGARLGARQVDPVQFRGLNVPLTFARP
jgi:hypothetical protein